MPQLYVGNYANISGIQIQQMTNQLLATNEFIIFHFSLQNPSFPTNCHANAIENELITDAAVSEYFRNQFI